MSLSERVKRLNSEMLQLKDAAEAILESAFLRELEDDEAFQACLDHILLTFVAHVDAPVAPIELSAMTTAIVSLTIARVQRDFIARGLIDLDE